MIPDLEKVNIYIRPSGITIFHIIMFPFPFEMTIIEK